MKVFTLPFLVSVTLLLILSTLYLNLYYPGVYIDTSEEMIANGSFDDGLTGWSVESPEIVHIKDGAVTIGEINKWGGAYVSQNFSELKSIGKVRLTGRIATESIEKGEKDYCLARLVMVSVDSAGEELWFLPHSVVALEGSHGFIDYSKIFTIFEGIKNIKVKAGKSCAGGIVKVDSVSMVAVEHSDGYKTARLFLLVFWIIASMVTVYKIAPLCHGGTNLLLFAFFVVTALAGTLHSPEWLLQMKISSAVHNKKPAHTEHTGADKKESQPASPVIHKSETGDKKPVAKKIEVESWVEKMRQIFKRVRAFGHGFVFFGLSVFAFRACRKTGFYALFVSLLLFAISSETLQLFADGRSAKLADAGINIFGVVSGLVFAKIIFKGSP